MDTSGSTTQDAVVKKSPFDDLNRDELVVKCKSLLALAQKAKQAKLAFQNEIESYKLQLGKCESEKTNVQASLKTLQELVDSLTAQKLNMITEVDSAKSKIKAFNNLCNTYEVEINKYKASLIIKDQNVSDANTKLSNLDSEVISLKRQKKRLEEENEQLINQLTEIEARTAEVNDIGLQQREQLQILEESVHSVADEALQIKVDELRTKVKELENELEASKKTKIEESENFEFKIKEITDLYESEKSKKEKANVKLKSYKDKILKCAACINQLKNSRYILTKTVKEYSENIPKWQNDIIKASKVLDDQVNLLSNENLFLKERVSILEAQIEELRKSLNINSIKTNSSVIDNNLQKGNNSLETELSNLQDQFNEMLLSNNNLQQEITALKLANQQLHEVDMAAYINENKLLKEQFSDNIEKNYVLTRANIEMMKSIEDLKTENEKLQESLQNKYQNGDNTETLNLQIKALESEKATLVKEKLTARDSVIELENHNKALTDLNIKLNVDIQSIKQELEIIANQNVLLQFRQKTGKDEENNMLKCTVMALQEQFELLKKEYDNMQDLNNLLKEEVETLKLSLEQPKDENLSDLNVSLQTDIVKLETKLAAYKIENSSLLSEIKESRNKIKEYDTKTAQYEENKSKLQNYKSENTELLNEMKEINQVLKERGESISKQQKAIAEMERLIDTLEKDRNKANEEKTVLLEKVECLEGELKNVETKTSMNNEVIKQIISDRDKAQSQLTENESIISALKEEIEKLKHHSSSHELPNEDMSTSTISKAEECSRMKDLDETFEEKYTKLRLFALKLKKKLNETLALLQNTQLDKAKLEKMLNENGHSDNKTAVKQGSDESMAGNNVSGGGDSSEVMELQAKLNSLTEASEKVSAELEKQKAELQTKCNELAAEIDAHKATKDSLEKARRDVKKKSVLSLEMEDYERSLKELATKMEEKKKKMVQMESTIDTQEGTITATRTQIKLLEEQIKAEETQNRLTKEELQHAIEDGKDKDNVIQAKNAVILKLEQDLEDEKRKNEEADLEMTTMISEKENIIMSLGEGKAELNNKVKRLEFKCSELNEKLKITVMELADLKTEYASYKVRAQAVLRQNQTVDHSQEEQLKEEAAALRAQIETFTSKLATLQEQCTEQSTEADNARRRASEAASEAARAQQRTARLHADLTRISQQLESERTQHKLQVSTLTQCYKTQMTEIEAKLVKETESLKKQLVGMQDSTKTGKAAVSDEAQHNQYMLPVIPKDDSDGEMDINVSMIPREEGEGSESAPTPPLSKSYSSGAGASRRSPVPLERLLEEGVPEDEAFDTSSLDLTSDQEIADLKRRLMATQQRVKHVTVLLSESERECARMAQLSELLKSELRRVRGTTNNAHNTEYMKNVTLKFLTLPPGDERSRLVPVLQKILTLTVEETQKINAVAKGLDPNPGKGWGSYLTWSGSPK